VKLLNAGEGEADFGIQYPGQGGAERFAVVHKPAWNSLFFGCAGHHNNL
jgi:hypothetical protein